MNENKFGTAKEPLKSKSNAVKIVDGKVVDNLDEGKTMGKKLGIIGHPTRGNEVIKLLEMMGGKNCYNLSGLFTDYGYYFIGGPHNDGICGVEYIFSNEDICLFSLEEFLEKYPFKVGDKVVYTKFGDNCDDYPIIIKSMKWTGTTIEYAFDGYMTCLAKDLKMWNKVPTNEESDDIKPGNSKCERTHEDVIFDSIIWHLRNSVNNGNQTISGGECEDYFREVVKKNNENKMSECKKCGLHFGSVQCFDKDCPNNTLKNMEKKKINQMSLANCDLDEVEIVLGDRFELKIKDGKYYAVRKKPKYPTTYDECCQHLGCDDRISTGKLVSLKQLINARNAYWMIAGEEMGIGKLWEPDWCNEEQDKYCISYGDGNIQKSTWCIYNSILAFPTEEMRDTFYENFTDLIEQCKELL